MNEKLYYRVSATVFAVLAIAHAARSVYGWDAEIAGIVIPLWVSYAAMVICAYLAYRGFKCR